MSARRRARRQRCKLLEATNLATPDFTLQDNAKSSSMMTGGYELWPQHYVDRVGGVDRADRRRDRVEVLEARLTLDGDHTGVCLAWDSAWPSGAASVPGR